MDKKFKILTYLNTLLIVVLVLSSFGVFHSLKLGGTTNYTTFGDIKASTAFGGNGNITAEGALTVAGNSYLGPVVLAGNIISGYGSAITTYTTSTTIAPAVFCTGGTLFKVDSGAASGIVLTFPAATTTYALCGFDGGAQAMNFVVNNSTNTITLVAGAGMRLLVASSTGYSTSTILAGSVTGNTGQFINSSTLYIYQNLYK